MINSSLLSLSSLLLLFELLILFDLGIFFVLLLFVRKVFCCVSEINNYSYYYEL